VTGVWDGLEAWTESQGLGLVYGSPEVIEIAKADVEGLRYLEGVSFPVQSVIGLSRPCPGYHATFNSAERPLRLPVPTTYGPYEPAAPGGRVVSGGTKS